MKKIVCISCIVIFILPDLMAQDSYSNKNASVSFDPLTFVGILLSPDEAETEFINMWFVIDLNWETKKQKEASAGIILQANRIALKTQYRSFFNKERQSGIFWGLYGLIEWRKMNWYYGNNGIAIGWTYPFVDNDNTYTSIGITGGFDIGFRIRINDMGITPYIGLGIPLFYCFDNLPSKKYEQEFLLINTALRAINIGLKLDFFNFRGTL